MEMGEIMQLYIYDNRFKAFIDQYQLTAEQLEYTGTPQESIALVKEDVNRHAILAIEDEYSLCYIEKRV